MSARCRRARKSVLVGVDSTFAVSDHDFSKFSLTPSICLQVQILQRKCLCWAEGFCSSTKFPTEAHRRAQFQSWRLQEEILMLYTDGGPDHRTNFISVQLSIIAIFLQCDLDLVVTARTPHVELVEKIWRKE